MSRRRKQKSAIWVLGMLFSLSVISTTFAGSREDQHLINGVIGNFPGWIQEAIHNGADINARGSSGEVALHIAIRMHNPDIMELLLKLGADVNARDVTGRTALHWAVYHEQLQMAKTLINHKADVDAKDARGLTPLHAATANPVRKRFPNESTNQNGYVKSDLARLLLAKGATVDAKSAPSLEEITPLMAAVSTGNHETAQVLLEHGADPNAKDTRGFPVLDIAAASDDAQSVRLLLKHGSNPDQTGPDGYTPLLRAIYAGKAVIVVALINGGATTKKMPDQYIGKIDRWRDDKGRTFAHVAAMDGGAAAIDFCISQMLLLGAFDNNGWTPLHAASYYGSIDAAARLLKAEVTVDRRQTGHDTALIVAADAGRKEIISLLLENGADPNIQGAAGRTALHQAAEGSLLPGSTHRWMFGESKAEIDERELRYESVIRLLLAAGADKSLRDKDGRTPYEVALRHENQRAVKLLKP